MTQKLVNSPDKDLKTATVTVSAVSTSVFLTGCKFCFSFNVAKQFYGSDLYKLYAVQMQYQDILLCPMQCIVLDRIQIMVIALITYTVYLKSILIFVSNRII